MAASSHHNFKESNLYSLLKTVKYKDVTYQFNFNLHLAISFYKSNPLHLVYGTVLYDNPTKKYFFIDRVSEVIGELRHPQHTSFNDESAKFNNSVSNALQYYNKNIFQLQPETYIYSNRTKQYYLIKHTYNITVQEIKKPYTKSMNAIINSKKNITEYTFGNGLDHVGKDGEIYHKIDSTYQPHVSHTQIGKGRTKRRKKRHITKRRKKPHTKRTKKRKNKTKRIKKRRKN